MQCQIIYGHEYVKPNMTKVVQFSDHIIGALTPGNKSSLKKKQDLNEDAMAVITQGATRFLIVADSHFGSFAADQAVSCFFETYERTSGDISERLLETHLALDRTILKRKKTADESQRMSASTLITVAIENETAYYCNTGDSRLYRKTGDMLEEVLDPQASLFVGDEFQGPSNIAKHLAQHGCTDEFTQAMEVDRAILELAHIHRQVSNVRIDRGSAEAHFSRVAEITGLPFPDNLDVVLEPWSWLMTTMDRYLPRWGRFRVRQGDVLLLATDGIEEDVSHCTPDDIETILTSGHNLEAMAGDLLKACMGRRGVDDNLTFILAGI